jgi:hypothetical protein
MNLAMVTASGLLLPGTHCDTGLEEHVGRNLANAYKQNFPRLGTVTKHLPAS